jgi:hypothetical protein
MSVWPSDLRPFVDVLKVVEVYIRATRDMTEVEEKFAEGGLLALALFSLSTIYLHQDLIKL